MIIENVPARVCLETGEQFFSPETVEYLQGKGGHRLSVIGFVSKGKEAGRLTTDYR